ncbi:hypothetical protein AB0M29_35330 [Streptomyces sp. NPDC051976]|uniref:hypothetical protein n=1 Tax=Streptomyces sp. NPDC051976 TaxID=3154947 RepID=UPI003433B460
MTIAQTRMPLPGTLLALLLLAVGCGASDTSQAPSRSTSSSPDTAAATGPSKAAALVCSYEAAEDIEGALGVSTTEPPKAVWSDHVNSCSYRYPSGTIRLSVEDLPDASAVTASFSAAQAAERASPLPGMGEQAFSVADGSVFVRKDLTVLHVDVSALPARLGTRTRSQVARTVATTVLICWKEQ